MSELPLPTARIQPKTAEDRRRLRSNRWNRIWAWLPIVVVVGVVVGVMAGLVHAINKDDADARSKSHLHHEEPPAPTIILIGPDGSATLNAETLPDAALE